MAAFTQTDWYRFPRYYDIVFGPDTRVQADFLEAALRRHGPRSLRKRTRVLEPACGSGRLVIELARRGYHATGFDASAEMLDYARKRSAEEPRAVRRLIRLHEAWMQDFDLRGPFDFAHCLLSTFKYLLGEDDAHRHLEGVARVLTPGGLYVIGLHLTDYSRRTSEREIWREQSDGVDVTCQTITRPANRRTRIELLRNRLSVRYRDSGTTERLETNWRCRTYDLRQLKRLIKSVPALQIVACYDFHHNINAPVDLERSAGDPVLVLQKTERN